MSERDDLAAWSAAGMPDVWDGVFDMRRRKRFLASPPRCGARIAGPPGGAYLVRDVGGERYYGLPVGEPGSHQYPPCPHPDCRALVPVPEDAPGGTYRCVCRACHLDLSREGGGLMRLELAGRP